MRVKKLEIFGFKSFANKTTIHFESGVTAIVGPNGSGKSNVCDSIRWVLGEHNPREVRAPRLEDVIFNGTDNKAPLSMAEVHLTISNDQGLLPISFSEVTLTRRVYRSGETECFINQSPCRLKDIRELFLGTGLGGGTYAIIEQGHIDMILSSKPEERRLPFEEASGVAKYLAKKQETIRRLDEVEEHLVRLADIIAEVRRQVSALERQANRARQYKAQWERLKELELRLGADELRQYRARAEALDGQLRDIQSATEELQQSKREEMAALEAAHGAISAVQEKVQASRADVMDCANQIRQHESQAQLKTSWISDLGRQAEQFQQELAGLSARAEQCQAQANRLAGAEAEVQSQLSAVGSGRAQDREELSRVEEELKALQDSVDLAKTQVFEAASLASAQRNELSRLAATLQELGARAARLESEQSQLAQADQEVRARCGAVAAECAASKVRCQALAQQISITQPALDAAQTRRQETSVRLQQLREQLASERAHGRMLHDLWRHYEGFSDTVKALMGHAVEGLVGPLVDLVQAAPGYEEVVEAALGPLSEAIVVTDRHALERCRGVLDAQSLEGARFLVLSDCMLAKEPQAVSASGEGSSMSIREVVRVEPAYQQLVDWVLNDSWMVEDLQPLMRHTQLPQSRLVSRSGERWDRRSWRLIGASAITRRPDGVSNTRIGRRHRWEQAQERISRSEQDLARVEADAAQAEQAWQEMLSQHESTKGQMAPLMDSQQKLESELSSLEQAIAASEGKRQAIATESQALESEQATIAEQESCVQSAVEAAAAQQQQAEQQLAQTQAKRETIEQRRQQLLIAQAQVEANFQSLKDRAEQIASSHRQLAEDRSSLEQQTQTRMRQREEAALHGQALTQELASHNQAMLALQARQACAHAQTEAVELSLKGEESKREQILPRLLEVEQQASVMSQKVQETSRQRSELDFRRTHILERLREIYQLDEASLQAEEAAEASLLAEDQRAQAMQEVQKLRGKLEGIGPVSLGSVEEYDELKRRLDFLQTQQQDLIQARDDLRASIAQINKTAKTQFKETFDRIKQEFQHYYTRLFSGGQADLILLDENDVLSSGIEIVARPPGKRLQSISLLSGGERALTAISLLFALFKVRPSPFCILDEIDAPLDEANIDRFTRVLDEFLELSQFILITHNKKTITKADSLYGVTMAEAGVSSVLSAKLKQPNAAAPDAPQAPASVPAAV
jgi:chromosome segregation protein